MLHMPSRILSLERRTARSTAYAAASSCFKRLPNVIRESVLPVLRLVHAGEALNAGAGNEEHDALNPRRDRRVGSRDAPEATERRNPQVNGDRVEDIVVQDRLLVPRPC